MSSSATHEGVGALGGDDRLGVFAFAEQLSEAAHLYAQVVLCFKQVNDLTQLGAGGVLGVGEVVHFHADLCEACFQGVTLGRKYYVVLRYNWIPRTQWKKQFARISV